MKQLFLLRHARTEHSGGLSDIERALTDDGKRDASALGKFMRHKGLRPDLVFCSPAKRTRQTLDGVLESLPGLKTEYPDSAYGAPCAQHIHLIRHAQDSAQSLMIVAHNPGIYELVVRLSGNASTDARDKLSIGYAPGTLSILECPCENWGDIDEGQNTLIDVLSPEDYT